MAYTSWKGSISLGLFNMPVKLEKAAKAEKIDTSTLCPDCEEPTKMDFQGFKCPECEKEISHWSKGDRGFEYEDEDGNTHYVRIAKEEREALKLGRSDTIELVGFVPADLVGFPRMETGYPYWTTPQDEGKKQYAIIQSQIGDRMALGKVVFRSKEYLIGLMKARVLGDQLGIDLPDGVDGEMLVACRLYYNNEIRPPSNFDLPEVTKEEREAAEEMISKKTITPEWDEYEDEYRESLKDLIEKRMAGETVEIEAPEEEEIEEDKSIVEAMKATAEA